MANLQVVDTFDNTDTGTRTVVVRDVDQDGDPGAMYHYSSRPPQHAQLSAEDWQRQVAAHALGLEARSRGVELPAEALEDPGRLGAAADPDDLGDAERDELAELRAQSAAADQVARDRAELEQLRAARSRQQSSDQEQPTA